MDPDKRAAKCGIGVTFDKLLGCQVLVVASGRPKVAPVIFGHPKQVIDQTLAGKGKDFAHGAPAVSK